KSGRNMIEINTVDRLPSRPLPPRQAAIITHENTGGVRYPHRQTIRSGPHSAADIHFERAESSFVSADLVSIQPDTGRVIHSYKPQFHQMPQQVLRKGKGFRVPADATIDVHVLLPNGRYFDRDGSGFGAGWIGVKPFACQSPVRGVHT